MIATNPRRTMKVKKTLLTACMTGCVFFAALTGVRAQEVKAADVIQDNPAQVNQSTPWVVSTINEQTISDSKPVTLKIALHLPPAEIAVKSVLLNISAFVHPEITGDDASFLSKSRHPWIRNADYLNQQGIVFGQVDTSSDANERVGIQRPAELKRDIVQAIKLMQAKFPQLPIDVGIFGQGAVAILDALKQVDGVRKVIAVSGSYLPARTANWS